jgi:hypothetical protein
MTEIRKSKQWILLDSFDLCILEFEIYLEFGAWNLLI